MWDKVGDTPLLSLQKIAGEEFKGNLFGKIESSNPTGLFSDRIANNLFKILDEKKKLQQAKYLVDIYKPNFTLSFCSKAITEGYKVVVFYEVGADHKEILQIGLLGCQVHECCTKREVLKDLNDFKDSNQCLNIGEELVTLKDELKVDLGKEISAQLEDNLDYLFISHEWKEFI